MCKSDKKAPRIAYESDKSDKKQPNDHFYAVLRTFAAFVTLRHFDALDAALSPVPGPVLHPRRGGFLVIHPAGRIRRTRESGFLVRLHRATRKVDKSDKSD